MQKLIPLAFPKSMETDAKKILIQPNYLRQGKKKQIAAVMDTSSPFLQLNHQLKGVSSFLQQENYHLSASVDQRLNVAFKELNKMNEVVSDMVDLIRIQNGLSKPETRSITLRELENYLTNTHNNFYPVTKFKLINTSHEIRVMVDQKLVLKVIDRLVSLAIELNQEGRPCIRFLPKSKGVEMNIEFIPPINVDFDMCELTESITDPVNVWEMDFVTLRLSLTYKILELLSSSLDILSDESKTQFRIFLPYEERPDDFAD